MRVYSQFVVVLVGGIANCRSFETGRFTIQQVFNVVVALLPRDIDRPGAFAVSKRQGPVRVNVFGGDQSSGGCKIARCCNQM